MTKDEFMSKMADAERDIRHSVVPLGIIYSVRLGSAFGIIYSAWLQWQMCGTDIQNPTLIAAGVCILLCAGSFPFERYSKRRFVRLALKCPECQSCLVFLRNDETAAKTLMTGCCYRCGKRVFDT
jgi:hypothetical protein